MQDLGFIPSENPKKCRLLSSMWANLLGQYRSIFMIAIFMLITACQTAPIERFSEIKKDMIKDDVLNIVGSPNRTEYLDGKEKWAYRFYTGDDKNDIVLKQVTFDGEKVAEAGDDEAEKKRLAEIKKNDEARALRREANKAKAAAELAEAKANPPKENTTETSVGNADAEPKPTPYVDFKEIKGYQGTSEESSAH